MHVVQSFLKMNDDFILLSRERKPILDATTVYLFFSLGNVSLGFKASSRSSRFYCVGLQNGKGSTKRNRMAGKDGIGKESTTLEPLGS